MYSWQDLRDALDILCISGPSQPLNHIPQSEAFSDRQPALQTEHQPQSQDTLTQLHLYASDQHGAPGSFGAAPQGQHQQHPYNPWGPAGWQSLNPEALALLMGFNSVEDVPWV